MPLTPEQTQDIARLRDLNLSPKQIARKLNLRPAEVTKVVRNQAAASEAERIQHLGAQNIDDGSLPPLVQCVVNQKAAEELLSIGVPSSTSAIPAEDPAALVNDEDTPVSGLASVILARAKAGQYIVTSYLIDCWCLGVKNVIGPNLMGISQYKDLLEQAQGMFQQPFVDITLKQAQAIVFGAVDYAHDLGLSPHHDFETGQVQLGSRCDTLMDIPFGRNGKPFYMGGPYDDSRKILKVLRNTVGENNFDFVIPPR